MAQQTLGTSGRFDAFLGGVRTTLIAVEQALLRLSSAPGDRQTLEEIYQDSSIIVASATLMACPTLAQIAQNMALLLFDILSGRTPLDSPNYTLLQSSFLHMQQVVGSLDAQVRSRTENRESFTSDSREHVVVIESSLSYPSSHTSFQRDARHNAVRHDTQPAPGVVHQDTVLQEEGTVNLAATIIGQYQRQKQTGRLWLSRGRGGFGEEGTITFLQGRILDAAAERRRGTEARNWLSTWEHCRYRFVVQSSVEPDGIESW